MPNVKTAMKILKEPLVSTVTVLIQSANAQKGMSTSNGNKVDRNVKREDNIHMANGGLEITRYRVNSFTQTEGLKLSWV